MLTKLIIDIQYASPAIENAVSEVASITLIKKWVKAATGYGGLLTLQSDPEQIGLNIHITPIPSNTLNIISNFLLCKICDRPISVVIIYFIIPI